MKYFKALLISLMSWVFVFTPQVYAQEFVGSGDLKKVVNVFNEKSFDLETAIALIKTKDSSKAKDFEKYIEKEKISKQYKLPLLFVEDEKISFNVQGEKFSIKILTKGDFELIYKNKSSIITSKASFEEMRGSINKMMSGSDKFSFFGLFINDAYADDLKTTITKEASSLAMALTILAGIAVIGTVYVLVSPFLSAKLRITLNSMDDSCEKLTGKALGPKEEKIIQDAISKIAVFEEECKNNLISMGCEQKVKSIKSCLEGLKPSLSKINNTSRSDHKERSAKEINVNEIPSSSAAK